MKKIILTIVIFITVTNFCFSQEGMLVREPDTVKIDTVETVNHSARIGRTVGLQIPNKNLKTGFGVNVFFHRKLKENLFISMNTGYHSYGSDNDDAMDVIPITAGVGLLLPDFKIQPYFGIEAGVTYRKYKNDNRSDYFDYGTVVFIPNVGVLFPLSKNIVLEANYKFQIEYNNVKFENIIPMNYYGINIGIAYLLP